MRTLGKATLLVLAGLALLSGPVFSATQEDPPGSKDHPLFNRMPDFHIDSYSFKEFDKYDKFMVAKGRNVDVEGRRYVIAYYVDRGKKAPSETQVIRNFTNALSKIGGEVLLETPGNVYMKLVRDGATTWVHVRTKNRGAGYTLNIVEQKAMAQEIVADAAALVADIRATGRAAVYGIYFDTGKSVVKPESEPSLKEIAKLLQGDPKLALHVVGHTDSVGEFSYNMKLSEARAVAVIQALSGGHGVDFERLKPHGVGPLAPVQSNETEEGRAKNRRVELVKQ